MARSRRPLADDYRKEDDVDPEPAQKGNPLTFEDIKTLFDSAPAKPGTDPGKFLGDLEGTCIERRKGEPDRSDFIPAQFLKVSAPREMAKGNRIVVKPVLTWKNASWFRRIELTMNPALKSWVRAGSDSTRIRVLERDRPYVLMHDIDEKLGALPRSETFCVYTKAK